MKSSDHIIASHTEAFQDEISCNIIKLFFGQVRPAKIQISLSIRVVWSESSMASFRIATDARLLHANEDD